MSAPSQPRIAIGMTLRNNARFLTEAIESLLNQTCADFTLVLVDDQSTDETASVAQAYARHDGRVTYFRNETHLGMTATWRRAFEHARQACPSAPYFAWASDHDRWAPTWLESLGRVLDSEPQVVLAYPLTQRMTQAGELYQEPEPTRFETFGDTDVRRRWKTLCCGLVGAGNMVYGLVRAEALQQCGIYRDLILPDRLLMAELTLHGQIIQVPEVLYFRRQLKRSTIDGQRRTLFGPRRAPIHAYLPWPLTHTGCLLAAYGWRPTPAALSRAALVGMCLRYFRTQSAVYYRKLRLAYERRGREKRLQAQAARLSQHRARRAAAKARRSQKAKEPIAERLLERMLHTAVAKAVSEQVRPALMEVTNLRRTLKGIQKQVIGSSSDIAQLQAALLVQHEQLVSAITNVAQRQDQLFAFGRAWRGTTVVPDDQQFHELSEMILKDGRTLLGPDRLFILWQAVRNVYRLRLPAAEIGCYRGGSTCFLARAFSSFLGSEVEFHAFDTFAGHPAEMVSTHDPFHKAGMFGDVGYNDVCEYLSSFQKLTIHKGEFSEVAKDLNGMEYGLVHVDTDLYCSTLRSLEYFGPRIARGGIIIVDDHHAPKCPGVGDAVRAFLRDSPDYTCWELPTEQALLVKTS